MIIFKTASDIGDHLQKLRVKTQKMGFVPTMGALHKGHLSLVEQCRKQNDLTICSIFINPSQFNNKDDFRLYPVTLEKDIELLILAGCDLLFLPHELEIYPPGYQAKQYALGPLEFMLEGKYRPGHFQGVCQVVDLLLDIIEPDTLYLGRKDYQQCMVISKLTAIRERKNPSIVISDTIREESGLAMSSRNARLNDEQKQQALQIFRALTYIKNNFTSVPAEKLKANAAKQLEDHGLAVDYVEIANAATLLPADNNNEKAVALIAATLGTVRLIDNMQLN